MKRLLLLILFLMSSISLSQAQFAGGSGTEEEPYQIETVEQLQEIRNHTDKHFIQISDIDASETVNWNDGMGNFAVGTLVGANNGTLITELYAKGDVSTRGKRPNGKHDKEGLTH